MAKAKRKRATVAKVARKPKSKPKPKPKKKPKAKPKAQPKPAKPAPKKAKPKKARPAPKKARPKPARPAAKKAKPVRAEIVPAIPVPRVTRVVPDAVLLSPRHPRLLSLAAEVAALERRKEMFAADRCVELGVHLREARMSLSHGDWSLWIREQTPLNVRSAQRYVMLSVWAQDNPHDYDRWRELGPTKLDLLVGLDDRQLRALRKVAVSRPKSEGPSLATASVRQLGAIIDELPKRLADASVRESVDEIVNRFESRVRRLNRDVQELLGERSVDADQLRNLRELLLEVVAALKTA